MSSLWLAAMLFSSRPLHRVPHRAGGGGRGNYLTLTSTVKGQGQTPTQVDPLTEWGIFAI